jgi:hypothetical protein
MQTDAAQCEECAMDEENEGPAEAEYDSRWRLDPSLSSAFDDLIMDVGKARDARRERMAFKSAAEMAEEMVNADRVVLNDDERQQLGEWLPGDQFAGDVNMRTLDRLLKRIDQRGYERSSQQLEFHAAFMRACGRILYRKDWGTRKPEIMAKHGWTKCNSEVLISTPRRFGVRRRAQLCLNATHSVCVALRRKHSASQSSVRAWRSRSVRFMIESHASDRDNTRVLHTQATRSSFLVRVSRSNLRGL